MSPSRRTELQPAAHRVLLNNYLLGKIATFLPPKDLLHARRTVATWNTAFIPQLRRRHTPIDLGYSDSAEKYTTLMKKSKAVPFGRYDAPYLVSPSKVGDSTFDEFFSVCGATVTAISVSCFGFVMSSGPGELDRIRRLVFEPTLAPNLQDLDIFVEVFGAYPPTQLEWVEEEEDTNHPSTSPNLRHLPNLKRLALRWSTFGGPVPVTQLQFYTLVQDLIQNASEIRQLDLSPKYSDDELGILPVLHSLRDYAPKLHNLKQLKIIKVKVTELQILEQLANRPVDPLRLEDFEILIDGPLHLEALQLFLITQFGSLVRLSIHLEGKFNLFISLSRMEALRALALTGEKGTFDLHLNGPTLGAVFPRLRTLAVNWALVESGGTGNVPGVVELAHPGVTDLRITGSHSSAWATNDDAMDRCVEGLAQRFPSVSRFEAVIKSDHLPPAIWTLWPTLTSLQIEYIATSDEGAALELDGWLSGIPRARFPILEGEYDYRNVDVRGGKEETLTTFRALCRKYKTGPGISDLVALQKFSLDISAAKGPCAKRVECRLTDLGAYFGLAMASQSLTQLQIKGCDPDHHFLSTDALWLIRAALGPHLGIEIEFRY